MESLEYKHGCALHTASASLGDVFEEVRRVLGPSDFNVLVLGETGTGKEGVARAIHHHSARKAKPFIAVNCGAIPEGLAESELFGHEKGAFTGADKKRKGHFEEAIGGTLFLDEIEELSLANQARLLRVLQEHELVRIGSSKPIKVDVRVIAATNRDLKELIGERKFRDDLFYRVAVETAVLPPLRERIPDISLLAELFVKELFSKHGLRCLGFESTSLARLESYNWPGNVRELQNALESASARCRARLKETPGQSVRIENVDLPSYLKPIEKRKGARAPDSEFATSSSDKTVRPYKSAELCEAINKLLQVCSPLTVGSLAHEIGRPRPVIKRQLKKMEGAGLVTICHRKGRLGDEVTLLR